MSEAKVDAENDAKGNQACSEPGSVDFCGGASMYHYAFYSEKLNGYFDRAVKSQRELGFHTLNAKFTDWRMRERLKTVSVALLLCLNIGIDPPDVVKTSPCAKLEGWIDPFSMPPQKALEAIGRNLQSQYEVWQPRARYRLSLDPTVDETRKLCSALRRSAKEERILFHYNGHGVPKPTAGGEIWVFNKTYTQYIPLSIYDVQAWLGSPCIFVYDCSAAGNIVNAFNLFALQRDKDAQRPDGTYPENYTPISDCIQLAACGPTESLPMNPDLPADVFSCCLTTPIEIALRWFVSQNAWLSNITHDAIMKIPGRLNDRRTPLGELNWIFTAITDTIAWNALPHDQFKRLFRQDLMVAALFRNFLLAERILRFYHCTPMSSPPLPPTHSHPMWAAWDLAADMCLAQLPKLLENGEAEYQHSTFFTEQLTAFEVWLSKGYVTRSAPEQLPIVLQVLLSQVHRLRALMLLSKFLDLGPWAVNLALSVGIFPYVLKLLQSPAAELKPVLVFIWAKLLAVDKSCQCDLLKDNGFTYFVQILVSDAGLPQISNLSEHRAMCAFILAVFLSGNFQAGKDAALKTNLFQGLVTHLSDPDPLLRQWACLCLGAWWDGLCPSKKRPMQEAALPCLFHMHSDPVSDVRAASLYTLSMLCMNDMDPNAVNEQALMYGVRTLQLMHDASPLLRKELCHFLSIIVNDNSGKFITAAFELLDEERKRYAALMASSAGRSTGSSGSAAKGGDVMGSSARSIPRQFRGAFANSKPATSTFMVIWKALLILSTDPVAEVGVVAEQVVDSVHWRLLHSALYKNSVQLDKEKPHHSSSADQSWVDSPSNASAESFKKDSGDVLGVGNASLGESNLYKSPKLALDSGATSSFNQAMTPKSVVTYVNNVAADPSHTTRTASVLTSNPPSVPFTVISSNNPTLERRTLKKSHSFYLNSLKPFFSSSSSYSSLVGSAGETEEQSVSGIESGFVQHSGETLPPVFDGENLRKELLRRPIDPNLPLEDYYKLPIKSNLLEWMSEYFAEPQMKIPDQENPGSELYNERDSRRKSVAKNLARMAPAQPVAGFRSFQSYMQTEWLSADCIEAFTFEQYDSRCVVAQRGRWLSLYTYPPESDSISRFLSWDNGNSRHSRIEAIRILNEEDGPKLVAAGSSDGNLRLWSLGSCLNGGDTRVHPSLVSGWRCFPLSSERPQSNSKLMVEWQQSSGTLACTSTGQATVKLWDLEKEALAYSSGPWDFIDSCITSMHIERDALMRSTLFYQQDLLHAKFNELSGITLTGAQVAGEPTIPQSLTAEQKLGLNVVYLGFGSGEVAVIDRRQPPDTQQGVASVFREHSAPVLDIQWQRGLGNLLVTSCCDGVVKFWDVRQPNSSLKTINLSLRPRTRDGGKPLQNVLAMACHEFAPLLACTTLKYTYIFNTDGALLSNFKNYHSKPILQFHRHDLLLGCSYYNPFAYSQGFQIFSSEARQRSLCKSGRFLLGI